MSGLDQITESILSAARQEADGILRQADERADEILAEGKKDAEDTKALAQAAVKKETEKLRQRAAAVSQQNHRQALLRARLEIIDQFIAAGREKILAMPDQEYFDFLYQIFARQNIAADGEILLSPRDRNRLPADFLERLNSADRGKVTLSQDAGGVENGFIVRCGKIEINCTIDSIFAEKDNVLRDRLNQYLSEE